MIFEGWVNLRKTVRLWPHRVQGEGHFVAVLQRVGGCFAWAWHVRRRQELGAGQTCTAVGGGAKHD